MFQNSNALCLFHRRRTNRIRLPLTVQQNGVRQVPTTLRLRIHCLSRQCHLVAPSGTTRQHHVPTNRHHRTFQRLLVTREMLQPVPANPSNPIHKHSHLHSHLVLPTGMRRQVRAVRHHHVYHLYQSSRLVLLSGTQQQARTTRHRRPLPLLRHIDLVLASGTWRQVHAMRHRRRLRSI